MHRKIRRLLTIAACATLLGGAADAVRAADSPSIYGTLVDVTAGILYANGVDGSTGAIYDIHDNPQWFAGGENTLYIHGS